MRRPDASQPSWHRRRSFGLPLGALLLVSCAKLPPPQALTDLEPVSQSQKSQEAGQYAPQQFAYAERLRQDAFEAHDAGDDQQAVLLAEHARVAYERAFVLARTAKAHARLLKARANLKSKEKELQQLDEEQTRVAQQASALELQARVLRDAEPLGESEKATPERELARRRAALSLAAQARLLCASAKLLANSADKVAPLLKELDEIEDKIKRRAGATPIDQSIALRSRCLKQLTLVRRPSTQKAPERGESDALLTRLSEAGHAPSRDDRGVVVTLRNVFEGTGLSSAGQAKLAELSRVAKAHARFPLVVALHRPTGDANAQDQARSKSIQSYLEQQGLKGTDVLLLGSSQPLVPHRARGAQKLNERVELVFVSPTSF